MREILFRGKTLATESKWVEGFYNHILCGRFMCDEHCIQTINEDGRIGQLYNVYDSTVGQFTGLTDKNGKKVFEGDIVKAYVIQNTGMKVRKYTETYVVAYHPKYCYFYLKRKGNNLLFDGNWAYGVFIEEVVGNIHDNPELLEVEYDG